MSNCPCICFRLVSLSELLPTFSWVARCCWILSDRRNLVFRRNICDPHLFRIFEPIDGKAIVPQHCPSSLLTTPAFYQSWWLRPQWISGHIDGILVFRALLSFFSSFSSTLWSSLLYPLFCRLSSAFNFVSSRQRPTDRRSSRKYTILILSQANHTKISKKPNQNYDQFSHNTTPKSNWSSEFPQHSYNAPNCLSYCWPSIPHLSNKYYLIILYALSSTRRDSSWIITSYPAWNLMRLLSWLLENCWGRDRRVIYFRCRRGDENFCLSLLRIKLYFMSTLLFLLFLLCFIYCRSTHSHI